nr:esterase-like activity of phytase family protein [Amycolatopsis marina]
MHSVLLCPAASAADVPAPEPVCAISDERLGELSGLAADDEHWYAVNDGGTRIEIFVLNRDCSVQRTISDPTDPYDVEDMARAEDGTLWLADTGDNRKQRDTVALHEVRPDGGATLYRLTYPDGPHDAEALLLDRAGVPYVITKNVLGISEVYRPTGPLSSPGPTPLENVGSLRLESTDTQGGPVGATGSVLVTGGAVSADGTVIALRTYTDAYLYRVPDGDIPAALRSAPVRVPLADENQGEAIAFTPDGSLLSASEGTGEPVRSVPGATGLVPAGDNGSAPEGASAAGDGSEPGEAAPSAPTAPSAPSSDSSGLPVLPGIAIAVVVAAVTVLGTGKLVRRRKRR